MTELPLVHPDRTETSAFQPLKALRHFRKLVADKEDTEQVFHIVRALSGKGFVKRAEAFWNSERGKAVLAEEKSLPERLDDHDALRKLPAGSVGRTYVDFMEREGLTAQGLVDEYEKFGTKIERHDDLMERYGHRLRDTHDLFHILTGYGRDALGEASVLAFSYSQNPNLGTIFIAYAAGREIKRDAPAGTPVFRSIRQAQRHGKAAGKIAHQDIMALLALPLEEARKKLGIAPPTEYKRAHAVMRAGGIDPYDMIGQETAAA